MDDPKTEQKRAVILVQAFAAFTTYGYKRTTMDDIARAAGLSRPALYLLYRNKGDIFRACMQVLMGDMQASVAQCFAGDAGVLAKVEAALNAGIVLPYLRICDTPHGREIFDAKYEFASDLFLAWIGAVESEIAAGLAVEARKGHIDLTQTGISVERLASLLLDAIEGMKMRMGHIDEVSVKLPDLVRLMIGPLTR
ncbi:TetR family transcriptional regulator [Ciceribacter naphthalenivorans]|uniref:TetR family transcriptional regulator n=3 Tax=Pseudomonadota TaxID=1224 RepID=A0A512HL59_9HYPH|nr:TetR family transcriptional regulator [Ciceribacter naphthalenivorans]GLR22751.1 TetR family transcriptional regulator [Ciceribacter naphthalenivorans]GLT05607.1 TetR family transcriptional regulator [Sphingomonas psychrolutea]